MWLNCMHPLTLLKHSLEHLEHLSTEVFNRGTKLYHCLGCTTSLTADVCDRLSWYSRITRGFALAYDPALKQSYSCWRMGPKHSGLTGFSDKASKRA